MKGLHFDEDINIKGSQNGQKQLHLQEARKLKDRELGGSILNMFNTARKS
jgi:hypothetical protein